MDEIEVAALIACALGINHFQRGAVVFLSWKCYR